ncbi:MAG: heavy metal-binding domain-containing protein [Bacteroidia bacterium]
MNKKLNLYPKPSSTAAMNFITYTCTNHPEIILNEPGKCPECGKDLVKKY